MADADTTTTINDAASWYELGFSRGLTEPALTMGVPKTPLVLNGIFAVIMIIDFGFWPILFVTIALHCLLLYVCKDDKMFFECLKAYINKKNYYSV